ncbi:MAG: methyltransferase domain-containing protein [Dehalococcoidia bacterium]|jgi:ubiquinone/menaquinone biosynthesis C-methylase UbiE|nr:methyltransferase domain-containing protein [Dehalococcoidia bacterium]MDW8009897.1 methyltransferase domain-containing protein [Chloroflexota bacterium]
MASVSERFTLEKFARHPFYQEVNRRLVKLTALRPGQRVVDLGAGTGAVTRLILEEVGGSRESEVIAVEPSASALEAARRNLANVSEAVVRFVHGGAERLSQLVKRPVDAVLFCNAIHLVREKSKVLQEVRRVLKEGGTFSFNTSFYLGAEPPESHQFYRRWLIKALRLLKTKYGLTPSDERTPARERLSAERYVALLEQNGFRIRHQEIMQVQMDLESFEDISEYELWIEGILPGIPLETGSAVLKESVRETFRELGITFSPRNWLLVVASRA